MTIPGGRKIAGRQYERTAREIIMEAIQQRNLTIYEMADIAERDRSTVARAANALHAEREIHIADWRVWGRGPHIAVYGVGDFDDVPNPRALTNAERCKKMRRRNAIPVPRDPIMRALLGIGR